MEKEINQLLADDQMEEVVGGVDSSFGHSFLCEKCGLEIMSWDVTVKPDALARCPICGKCHVMESFYIGRVVCPDCGAEIPREAIEPHLSNFYQCKYCGHEMPCK